MENNEVKKTETVSIVGFIMAFFMPLVGLILSIIGISKAKKNNNSTGLGVAGLIISIFLLICRIILLFIIFVFLGFATLRGGDSISKRYNDMCEHAQKCEHLWGDYYNCTYRKDGVSITGTCHKDHIPEKQEEEKETPSDDADLERIKDAAAAYYTNIYDGLYHEATIEEALNTYIIALDNFKIYVDKDTLKGVDSEGRKVDLNNYLVQMH